MFLSNYIIAQSNNNLEQNTNNYNWSTYEVFKKNYNQIQLTHIGSVFAQCNDNAIQYANEKFNK